GARAAVEGRLLVTPEVAREVEEAGGDLDDNGSSLVLSRSVSAEGRSRAFAGGHSVPVSLLQVLADDLVAVHGQSDQQQLLKPGRQRDALDRFGGQELAGALSDYRRVYSRHRAVRDELEALTQAERERAAEAVRSHDAALAGLGDRLSEASYLISDVAGELASYTDSLDADPARLAAVQERRAALGRLVRAYGAAAGDVAAVLDWAKQAG